MSSESSKMSFDDLLEFLRSDKKFTETVREAIKDAMAQLEGDLNAMLFDLHNADWVIRQTRKKVGVSSHQVTKKLEALGSPPRKDAASPAPLELEFDPTESPPNALVDQEGMPANFKQFKLKKHLTNMTEVVLGSDASNPQRKKILAWAFTGVAQAAKVLVRATKHVREGSEELRKKVNKEIKCIMEMVQALGEPGAAAEFEAESDRESDSEDEEGV